MRAKPKPQELYRHFKGNTYQIVTIAIDSEDGSEKVVYQALYGDYKIYVRDLDMFMSEVDHKKYPEVKDAYRFTKVETAAIVEKKTVDEKESLDENGDVLDLDPRVLQFLDADNYQDKLQILHSLKEIITDDWIDIMAASEEIEIKSGDILSRYEELKNCLLTFDRFECTRLR